MDNKIRKKSKLPPQTKVKRNKYPKSREISKSIIFTCKWTGNRTPEVVIFPNGRPTKVNYMRDGKILFESGDFGVYIRTLDNNETEERAIQIEIEE